MSSLSTPTPSLKRRRDGRYVNQLRPLSAELGVIQTCDGSARFSLGDTRVLAGIHGPRPARTFKLEDPENAQLEISLTPVSGPAGPRELAMAAVLRSLFEGAIVRSEHPRTIITIAIHVQRDEGSCLAACINAVSLALADACVPIHGLVAGLTGAVLGPAAFVRPGQMYKPPQEGQQEERLLALDASRYEEGLPRVPVPPEAPQGEEEEHGQQRDPNSLQQQQQQEDELDVTGADALFRARAAAVPKTVQLHALATAAWISSQVNDPAQGPAALQYTGNMPYSALQELVRQMKDAAAIVLAFLRVALKKKVASDARHFENEELVIADQAGPGSGPREAADDVQEQEEEEVEQDEGMAS